jgi:hypothetical protein
LKVEIQLSLQPGRHVAQPRGREDRGAYLRGTHQSITWPRASLFADLSEHWIDPEFLAQVREAFGVHAAPVLQQLAERDKTGGGE